jgi:hypothetical protein
MTEPKLVRADTLHRGDVVMIPPDYGYVDWERGPYIVTDVTPNYLTLKLPFGPTIVPWMAGVLVELLERPNAR